MGVIGKICFWWVGWLVLFADATADPFTEHDRMTSVTLTLGIVGLPNVGKSTLFNALTRNDVLAANYPFATIEPNVAWWSCRTLA